MMAMDETQLLAYLKEEADSAYHHAEGDIANDRLRAQRDYLRRPYGNEEEGRSSVVASDVFDAVEGMLPDLVDVFVSTDKAVVFEPVGPEDEEAAEQTTAVANYVFYKQNNGFLTLYTAAKDALLLKTGGVKWYWETKRTPTFTTYRNVDEMQLAVFLATNPKAEVLEKDEVEPKPEEIQQAQMAGMPLPQRYTVKIKVVEEKGKVKLCNIPPEELHVSRRHNSILLDDCPYVAHVAEYTYSEIKEMGYDVTVDQVKAARNETATADDDYRETQQGGKWGWWNEDNDLDPAMVRGYLREEYVLVDFDGDGIAERRRVVRLGDEILENKECSHVPIAAWTPYILTHRFDGLSVADLVSDFQRISTEIMRQQLDNLYLANNQETIVLTDGQGNPLANIDDLLNRRPGGIIRERAQGAVRPYQERWQGIEAMPMIEMLDSKKENRTGYTKYSQGLDANALNKTATGVSMIMNASQKRMKLMARIMAECLVAPIFKGILKTLSDYSMEELSFRLTNKFVQYDPQEWRDQFDMTINVGLGTSDAHSKIGFLNQMAQAQMAIAQTPFAPMLISPKTVFNLQARIAENAGFKNPREFWVDPDTVPPQPEQKEPPLPLQIKQMEIQADMQKLQIEIQSEMQAKQAEMQANIEKARAQNEIQAMNDQRDSERELMKARYQAEIEEQRLQFEKWKAELDARVKLRVAAIGKESGDELLDAVGEAEVFEKPSPIDQLAVMHQQTLETIGQLAAQMNRPKQVIRGDDGKVIGVA